MGPVTGLLSLTQLFTSVIFACLVSVAVGRDTAHQLVGSGDCRGDGWAEGAWPVGAGKHSLKSCSLLCTDRGGCTGFSLSQTGDCFLFGHSDLVPADSVGGGCYKVIKQTGEKTKKSNKPKEEVKVKPSPEESEPEVEKKAKDEEVKKAPEKPTTPAPTKVAPTKEDAVESTIGGKYIVKVGDGGCRGQGWNSAPWPIDQGRQSPRNCALACLEKSCTAFHQLHPAEDGTVECFLFSHKAVLTVPRVGGECLTLSDTSQKDIQDGEEEEEELEVEGPVHMALLGNGRCRGPGWTFKRWPSLKGFTSPRQCAEACARKKGCTAFDLSDQQKDNTFDCVMYGHKSIIPASGVPGNCYVISEKEGVVPESLGAVSEDGGDEEEEEEEQEVTNPVHMALLGNGRCRGPDWTFKKWPALRGFLSARQCAESCARKKGCTAFDLSQLQSDKTFDCVLYGHSKVAPASNVPGNCYVLSEKEGIIPGDTVEEKDDEDEHVEVDGPVHMALLGKGRCRGPEWTFKKWPSLKGFLSARQCAEACAHKKGCTAFDLSELQSDKTFDCVLYGHKKVEPAIGVPGNCYVLSEKEGVLPGEEEEEEEEEDEEIDDGKAHEFTYLGHGMCRGANWQDKRWPKVLGPRSLQDCANSCGRRKGCTGFDVSKQDGDDFDCMLYGHKHPVSAPGVPGECYGLLGAVYSEEEHEVEEVESRRPSILDEEEEDFTDITDVELLGKGACRGQGWQDGQWPLVAGRKTIGECAAICKDTSGCVAFDLSGKDQETYDCLLLGHSRVLPASAINAKCYVVKGATTDPTTLTLPDSVPTAKKTVDTYPTGGPGFAKLGAGLCRGHGWSTKGWPKDVGVKTVSDCAATCEEQKGCTAFDISDKQEENLYCCLLFGHIDVVPASSASMSGACYIMGLGILEETQEESEVVEEEEEDLIIDLEGDIDVALLGKGGCRGAGWQDKNWPKVKGFMSIDDCGRTCVATRGCTAFHTASQQDGFPDDFECFLFGHHSVVPALGLTGNCYTVAKGSSQVVKSSPAQPAPTKKTKVYKIPEFEEPTVVEDTFEEDEDEWLFEPPPSEIRSRDHITQILGLNEPTSDAVLKVTETTLKELKKVYESSIKDLEKTYKYKELSNRHFGDPEMFNKPLVVLMGPWSGGKSTMINYLLGTEFTGNAFRSTAEPSPGFNFNIAMYGETEEEVDGTQMAAEWAFSSLQKFGNEFLKKLRGKKMPNKLLEKATFAEIPGVLETGTIRKIDRRYPFNDACQWFIDHADLIILVYDYAKLDIGPETEALLDQLKGRESQVRIVLNKADEITAEELLKIQGNLVWNVSPLMASVEPPTLYAGSFWSRPYRNGAPKRLLKSQEQSLLKDVKDAIDRRVENRIATARRFAVRVRNHAKMVDCYLTTYKNNKGIFGDKKRVAQDIIDNPSKYHIYEGLSTLTNISRYDLPDPDTYRDFFNVHPLYDFPSLQSTCTFFKGCPLNKLDISIAYELPEILTGFKRKVVNALNPASPTVETVLNISSEDVKTK